MIRSLFLALALLAAPAFAQPSGSVDVDAGNDGLAVGVIQVSTSGSGWNDLALSTFNEVTTDSIDNTDRIVNISVHNTHATQTLYFLLKNSSGEATSVAIAVVANGTVNLSGLLKINGGQGSAIVSVNGDAGTTGQIIVQTR